MIEQSNGKIYLENQRGCSQTEGFRSFHTFHFGAYNHVGKEPFGALQVLNDDTLAGEKSVSMRVEANTDIILLPIVGAIGYKNSLDIDPSREYREGGYISSGEVQIFSVTKNSAFEVSNPYETELVNYLQIWIKNTSPTFKPKIQHKHFNLNTHKNQLLPLFSIKNTSSLGFIGQFEGREEATYTLKNPKNGVFTFIIEGAFEVQNRLLEARDSLALWAIETVELEALSNNALILLLEIPF